MEYAPHGDLEECVKENLPEPEVQTIAVQLVEALTLMHQKNFTHRDLKPSVSPLVLFENPLSLISSLECFRGFQRPCVVGQIR